MSILSRNVLDEDSKIKLGFDLWNLLVNYVRVELVDWKFKD